MKKQALQFLAPLLIAILPCAAMAETLDDWYPSTVEIIQKYEGSSTTKVTADTDFQGLSVGILQWTVAAGSFADLVRKVGSNESKKLADQLMPNHAKDFKKVIDLSLDGKKTQARTATLVFQEMGKDKNTGKMKGVKVKAEPLKELQAWLGSPKVALAQEELVRQKMRSAVAAAKKWKSTTGDKSPVQFYEFMFFVDAMTHGGLGGFTDGALAEATTLVLGGGSYTDGDMTARKKMLVNYLAEWLSVEWPQANDKRYYGDAKNNAKLLKENLDKITLQQLQLLYMKYVRASVGNAPYHLVTVNRGVISTLGEGWVNQTHYDFKAHYRARKPLD